MDQTVPVAQMYERLLELASPLSPLDLPLLDAHGATMASDLLLDEKVAIKSGAKISSTQIALAASLGYRDWETDRKSTRLNSSH